jgi:deazaflavin-dependent oxidoreductase (nitroreductase family)
MTPRRPSRLVRTLLGAPARLYDWNAGWLLGRRFLRLTHVGRRSGRRYQTVLEVIGAGATPDEVLVIAGLGTTTDWYRNLRRQPAAEVTVGRRTFRPAHRVLDEAEAAAALAAYERRNRWVMPVVRRVLSWLVGWRYDGSPAAQGTPRPTAPGRRLPPGGATRAGMSGQPRQTDPHRWQSPRRRSQYA